MVVGWFSLLSLIILHAFDFCSRKTLWLFPNNFLISILPHIWLHCHRVCKRFYYLCLLEVIFFGFFFFFVIIAFFIFPIRFIIKFMFSIASFTILVFPTMFLLIESLMVIKWFSSEVVLNYEGIDWGVLDVVLFTSVDL